MHLNRKQKLIVSATLLAIVAMCAFPPWSYTVSTVTVYSEAPAGYSFIATPPAPRGSSAVHGVKLDLWRLLIQCLGAVALAGFGVVVAAD
jgi:hypothetical protein